MEFPGFFYSGEFAPDPVRVYFIEYKGKDISFDRWRFSLYYEPHLAALHFEHSEQAAQDFLAQHREHTYPDYSEWRRYVEAAVPLLPQAAPNTLN